MGSGLRLSAVSKFSSNGKALLDDISLEIAPGEIVAIVGQAGCGKSLLLKAIAGLTPIDSGDISYNDQDIVHIGPHQRNVAMTFQNEIIFGHLNAGKNILLGIKQDKLSQQEQRNRLDLVAKRLLIEDILKSPISALSDSQRQQIALARSLIREANFYLFDEPFQNFGRMMRVNMRKMLRDLKVSLQRPIIFTTQNSQHALSVADRVAVMERGKLIEIGTPCDVYSRPKSLTTAALTGMINSDFQPVDSFTSNTAAHVACIRPENMSLTGTGPHFIEGTVWTIDFFGEFSNINVKTTTGALITVPVYGAHGVEMNSQVNVFYDPKHVMLFDEAGARIDP